MLPLPAEAGAALASKLFDPPIRRGLLLAESHRVRALERRDGRALARRLAPGFAERSPAVHSDCAGAVAASARDSHMHAQERSRRTPCSARRVTLDGYELS